MSTPSGIAIRDANRAITLIGVSSVDFTTPVNVAVDPTTGNVKVDATVVIAEQNVNLSEVGGTAFALGQQLDTTSLPVVLTASQLTTLTPPSNTGYALDSSLTTIDTDIKSNITLHAGINSIGTVGLNAGTNVIGHVIVDSGTITSITDSVAVTGTFWQATQPVSASSLPLPTGASTAAKQPALGVAGTASTDVITVQGITSMTPLKVDGSAVTQPVSGTFWQATQPVSGTVTANIGTGDLAGITATVVVKADTAANQANMLKVDASGATVPVSGTFYQATQPVSVATLPALAAGTNSIGTVQPGNTQNTTPWLTAPSANSSAVGASFNYQSALAATAVQIKATAANFYGYHISNVANSAVTYIQIFNKTSANVTLGTTVPDFVLVVPPAGVLDSPPYGIPIALGTAFTVAATTTAGGLTAPTTALNATFFYI